MYALLLLACAAPLPDRCSSERALARELVYTMKNVACVDSMDPKDVERLQTELERLAKRDGLMIAPSICGSNAYDIAKNTALRLWHLQQGRR